MGWLSDRLLRDDAESNVTVHPPPWDPFPGDVGGGVGPRGGNPGFNIGVRFGGGRMSQQASVGNRPEDWGQNYGDFRQLPGIQEYIDRILSAGGIGIGPMGRRGKRDVKRAESGRIEEMSRLKPVLSAIRARSAMDVGNAQNQIRSSLAFENQPTLEAAMMGEVTGRINRNASGAFADAAAGAYESAARDWEAGRARKLGMRYTSALDAGNLYARSILAKQKQGSGWGQVAAAGAAALPQIIYGPGGGYPGGGGGSGGGGSYGGY